MHRKFIATIIAAALTVTVIGNAPARADNDALKALAAIAGIAIVGKVIHDRNKRKSEQHSVTRHRQQAPVYRPNTNRVIQVAPRPLPSRASRKLLPGDCLRSVQTYDGRVRYFGQRCLERHYSHVKHLPQQCAVRFQGNDWKRRGYEARCLRRSGYKLARN